MPYGLPVGLGQDYHKNAYLFNLRLQGCSESRQSHATVTALTHTHLFFKALPGCPGIKACVSWQRLKEARMVAVMITFGLTGSEPINEVNSYIRDLYTNITVTVGAAAKL